MLRIKVTSTRHSKPLIRQLSQQEDRINDCQFFVDTEIDTCDWWFVLDGLPEPQSSICPPEHTVLITNEPPSIKKYDSSFLKQFYRLITCRRDTNHPRAIIQAQGHPWFIGATFDLSIRKFVQWMNYEELKHRPIHKTKLLSVVTSNKDRTDGHKKRLEFIEKLRQHFGDQIDILGSGYNYVPDKWNGIAPYKYHIALENTTYPDYWSEKLADAFIGEAYPFYHGCPNINDYFAKDSLTQINIENPDEAIKLITQGIQDDLYGRRLLSVREAKKQVLEKYNVFALIRNFCLTYTTPASPAQQITLFPERQKHSLKYRLAQLFKKVKLTTL